MKSKIFIAIGAIGLMLIFSFSLSFYYGRYQINKSTASLIAQKKEQEENYKKALAAYDANRQATLAQKLANCYKPDIKEKDGCLYLVAREASREEYCDKIEKNETKNSCHDSFALEKAVEQTDSQECLAIGSSSFKNQCLENFYLKFKKIDECDRLPAEYKSRCSDVVNNSMAFSSNNISTCDAINDKTFKAVCKLNIKRKPKDSDGDGITDSMENSYGTNAFKADTDGDGLSEWDEIMKYQTNPLKPDTCGYGITDGEAVKLSLINNGCVMTPSEAEKQGLIKAK